MDGGSAEANENNEVCLIRFRSATAKCFERQRAGIIDASMEKGSRWSDTRGRELPDDLLAGDGAMTSTGYALMNKEADRNTTANNPKLLTDR